MALQLPPGHGKIEFAFTALSYNSPENVHFRHLLKGFDTDWIEAGAQRSAKYPPLPAGRYEFVVTACNDAGVWSEVGFHLPLVVRPFYWQTWWFRLGTLTIFTLGVIAIVRYVSFRRLRQRMVLLEGQAELISAPVEMVVAQTIRIYTRYLGEEGTEVSPQLPVNLIEHTKTTLQESLKAATNLTFHVIMEPPGALPRYTLKAKRFKDLREAIP